VRSATHGRWARVAEGRRLVGRGRCAFAGYAAGPCLGRSHGCMDLSLRRIDSAGNAVELMAEQNFEYIIIIRAG